MAKIAADENGATPPAAHVLARGDGWSVSEVICTLGPRDRPFEERHSNASVAVVAAGTFQYRAGAGRELMTPGSLLLGSPGQPFECGHEHGAGDRCLSFSYAPAYFERLASDAGARGAGFRTLRLPPLRSLAPVVARASAALAGRGDAAWEEIGVQLAAQALQLDRGTPPATVDAGPGALARVTRVVRMIDGSSDISHPLGDLAREARLSPYHFLRTFQGLTGVTPHQYLLRLRLRRAAVRLTTELTKIVDIALECGFGDISNFVRTFRAEFGVSPRKYRGTWRAVR